MHIHPNIDFFGQANFIYSHKRTNIIEALVTPILHKKPETVHTWQNITIYKATILSDYVNAHSKYSKHIYAFSSIFHLILVEFRIVFRISYILHQPLSFKFPFASFSMLHCLENHHWVTINSLISMSIVDK